MDKADFKLAKIGVVMLGVQDMVRAVAFYRDKLGLTLLQEIPGFAFFDGGGVTLALSLPVAKASERMNGATEVVFSVDEVRSAYETLRGRGVEFTQQPRVVSPPMWAANFRDPDGHKLSIFGPEKKA